MKKNSFFKFIVASLLFLVCYSSFSQSKGKIIVQINGVKGSKGFVLVALYNQSKGFPEDKKKVFRKAKATIKNGSATVEFTNLPYGDYAVAAMHDENNNQEMDKNFLGVPEEGYCFSNNIKPKLSAPSFKDCKFQLNAQSKTISVNMIY